MTLAIEPMRTMERPSGSALLPGRVSPYPSTMDSSPRTTASTRPGAPGVSHITAPAMDAASLRTMSAARAGVADAPAASIAQITAGRSLVDLRVMGTPPVGRSMAQDSAALRGSTLYASGEPCAMCMGAILWCRLGRLVFAASVAQLATKIDQIMLSSAEHAAKAPFAPISITGGVLADEAVALFVK